MMLLSGIVTLETAQKRNTKTTQHLAKEQRTRLPGSV